MAHLRSSFAIVALASALTAAPQGVAPGYRMIAPHNTTDTLLIDTNNNVVHTWPGVNNPGNGAYLDADGNLIRTEQIVGAPPIGGRGGGLTKVAYDGTMLWDWEFASSTGWAHHDIALLPNGNVLMIVWDRIPIADAIAAGRDPSTLQGATEWLPDSVIEVEQTGLTTANIVWRWNFMDHIIQDFDSSKANFGVVADHPEKLDINFPGNNLGNGEWNHCNAIAYDPVNDVIILNSPFQSEFYLIDHSTTTAEAAGSTGGNFGKGGDFLYRWGNPASYDRGTAADQTLFFPHGTYIIPEGIPGAGNVLVFNNRAGQGQNPPENYSTVVEIDIPSNFSLPSGQAWGPTNFVWEYQAPNPTDLFSAGLSNAERLPNGNTLICSGRQFWLFEVTPTGSKVWETFPTTTPSIIFQVSYYERSMWQDTNEVSISSGGVVNFEFEAGSGNAGVDYLVLGSGAGTSPGTLVGTTQLPLNLDGYFLSMLSLPNVFPFGNTTGQLDATGGGSASFTMPAGILPPAAAGLTFDHLFLVLDVNTGTVQHVSNTVPLRWTN